jgi:hypothetical protein
LEPFASKRRERRRWLPRARLLEDKATGHPAPS